MSLSDHFGGQLEEFFVLRLPEVRRPHRLVSFSFFSLFFLIFFVPVKWKRTRVAIQQHARKEEHGAESELTKGTVIKE